MTLLHIAAIGSILLFRSCTGVSSVMEGNKVICGPTCLLNSPLVSIVGSVCPLAEVVPQMKLKTVCYNDTDVYEYSPGANCVSFLCYAIAGSKFKKKDEVCKDDGTFGLACNSTSDKIIIGLVLLGALTISQVFLTLIKILSILYLVPQLTIKFISRLTRCRTCSKKKDDLEMGSDKGQYSIVSVPDLDPRVRLGNV
ncbi:hypothetical protein [Melon chlorotic spot virus]|uniref:Uncharacterized protein n=1 Tax=Melon chlorotic spot virus TaxID=2479459 RepID=A0A3G1Z1J3_9VIRU|nr:hypothetical protein [Melon chlorotic spot virus]AYL40768.1 hypothetical protein [Melon chlorotic spot virus]